MNDNYKLIDNWLMKTLADNPEILQDSKTHVDVYQKLYEIWLLDCQRSLKAILTEVMK